MSAARQPSFRPARTLGLALYGLCLMAGTLALTGSLVHERFSTVERADPGATHRAHRVWCKGALLSLRSELEEAFLQELAARRSPTDLSRAEQVRRSHFKTRLDAVRARCDHSDLAINSAMGLAELNDRYSTLMDELYSLRTGLADAVDHTLMHLKAE